MKSYRAYQVTGRRNFAMVERELRDPPEGQLRLRTLACGVCHSDVLAVEDSVQIQRSRSCRDTR